MAEVLREPGRVRVVLVDGETTDAMPIVEEVRRSLEDDVREIVFDLSGGARPPGRDLISDVMRQLAEEVPEGIQLRFKL